MNDPRPRLSVSQQAQILSDVQQHQQRYRRPTQDTKSPQVTFPTYDQVTPKYQQSNTPYASLAKYKVDRTKQQQLQHLLEQQQQVQQLLQQQQQKIARQLGNTDFAIDNPQFQHQQYQQLPHQQQYNNQFQNGFPNLHQDLSQPLFSDQQTLQLQEYFEKQRELELLQKQRQQLLYEQQELRRQQELLRLQQLQKLTSTTPSSPSPPSPSTVTETPFIVSTTSSPLLLSPTARRITPSEAELFLKAIANHQKKYSTTTTSTTTTTTTTQPPPSRPVTSRIYQETSGVPENLLSLIQEQESQLVQQGKPKPQIKVIYQTEKPSTTRQSNSSGRSRNSQQSVATLERELLLKQLKLALAQSGDDDDVIRNVTTRDLILPNGKKLQVIHAPNDLSSIVPTSGTPSVLPVSFTTTIKPPKAIFEELTKGVLPPGADFEIIRQKSDGKLEEVGRTPIQSLPAKKVTFVVLEEQPDGSYKVQGVKGNAEKESGTDVESIVERIKKGELKLPPSSLNPTTPSTLERYESNVDPNLISTNRPKVSSHHSIGTSATTFRSTTVRSASTRHGER